MRTRPGSVGSTAHFQAEGKGHVSRAEPKAEGRTTVWATPVCETGPGTESGPEECSRGRAWHG
eukprot:6491633-Amphidinium_carterae.2